MEYRKALMLLLFISVSASINAQYFNSQNTQWKRQRQSVGFGLGVANFLGELGGRDEIGSDFIYDLEFSQTRPALQVNYRYQLGARVFSKAQLSFGIIGGNDALTEETFRRNRNLSFRSTITELSAGLEFEIIQFNNNSRYNRVATAKKHAYAFYLSAAVGAARFNPKANYRGRWYALKPLSTEGQELENGPEPYKLITIVLPLGAGFRYGLSREWTLGAELTHRITFSDYIDDVSTVYYDNDALRNQKGELSALLADPSLGYYLDGSGNEIPLNSTATGYQRGDPADNDSYFFFTFNAYYKFTEFRGRTGRGRVTKRRKRRTSF